MKLIFDPINKRIKMSNSLNAPGDFVGIRLHPFIKIIGWKTPLYHDKLHCAVDFAIKTPRFKQTAEVAVLVLDCIVKMNYEEETFSFNMMPDTELHFSAITGLVANVIQGALTVYSDRFVISKSLKKKADHLVGKLKWSLFIDEVVKLVCKKK